MKVYRTDGAHETRRLRSRRTFLQAGSLALAGLSELASPKPAAATQTAGADAVIQIVLSGGPSQLDTWDPKPLAPSTIRGPFRPICTTVPGMQISELFPQTARHASQIAIVRSLSHDAAPAHEIGIEILESGGRFISAAQTTPKQPARASWFPKSDDFASSRYGNSDFGRSCLEAVRLVQAGSRFVKIFMFPFPLYDALTWDCHANEADLTTTLNDYRTTVCPMFDQAFSALLDDLATVGLLQRTLVVCAGEFGRSPKLNPRGGRDHWTGVWSAIFAGGGVRGGQVIGSSDRHGTEPRDRPVAANQVPATILYALGISQPGLGGMPILDLF